MWIELLLTCYGVLNGLDAQVYITVSASYVVKNEPFFINCSSDVPPLGDAVSFGKESVDILNVRYLSSIPACYGTLSSGYLPPFKCKQQCECSKDRRSYQWTFNSSDVNDVNTFHCTMLFPMSGLSTHSVFILQAVAPELNKDTNASSGEDIRIADGENLNITVLVSAHPGPTSVFWLFRKDENTSPVKILKNCTTHGQARYICSLWIKDANQNNFGRYILHFQNEIGFPLIAQFLVKGKEMPSPPDVNVTCAENKVSFYWISGFDGGEKQIFHVIALSELEKSENILSSIADAGSGTHNKLLVDIEPGRYTFYIFTNNSYGGVNSSTTVCSVLAIHDVPNMEQSSSYPFVAVAIPPIVLTVLFIMSIVALAYRDQRRYSAFRNEDRIEDKVQKFIRLCEELMKVDVENNNRTHYHVKRRRGRRIYLHQRIRQCIQDMQGDIQYTYQKNLSDFMNYVWRHSMHHITRLGRRCMQNREMNDEDTCV